MTTRTAPTAAILFGALVVTLCIDDIAGVAAAHDVVCPLLKNAVYTTADYNNTELGLPWFTRRGLTRDGQYGCMTPDPNANTPYTFALGCQCGAWATCHSRNIDYSVRIDDQHSSRLGECRCCSWWLITLIVVGSLGLILFATQVPRIKRYVDRKMRERRRAKRSAMAAIEEGDARELTGVGSHADLNGSANDRYNSELKSRRTHIPEAPRCRRQAAVQRVPSGAPQDSPPSGASWEPPGAERSRSANAYAVHDDGAAVPVYLDRATPQFDASGSGMRSPRTEGSPKPTVLETSFGSQPDVLTFADEDTR